MLHFSARWTGDRAAEGTGLLNRRRGVSSTAGSNPALSASTASHVLTQGMAGGVFRRLGPSTMPRVTCLTIDLHTHVLPERWPDLAERYGCGGWMRLDHPEGCSCGRMMLDDAFFRDVEPNCWDSGVRIQDCDLAGVDVQVLSTVPVMFNYHQRPQHTHDLSQFLNDHIAGVVQNAPDRFIALGTLPMQDSALAIKELERWRIGVASSWRTDRYNRERRATR